jgi:nuclear polyadenylated RNA-binding protein NAB2
MAVEISSGTPMAEALQSLIQPKLEALEWSSGGDDSALSEYIVLMLANGKTQDEIASELFNDFKDLGANEASATEFSRWLFEQVQTLQNQNSTGSQQQESGSGAFAHEAGSHGGDSHQDAQMGDTGDSAPHMYALLRKLHIKRGKLLTKVNRPTGPKAMRNGNTKSRNGRVLGQMNKAMDRSSDAALHRVRGSAGAGRINTHANRELPKGPRNQMSRTGQANQMGRGQMAMGLMAQGGQFNPMNSSMSPHQQMQMLQYWEEGARMMQQMLSMQGMGGPVMNPAFQQQNQQQGRSLFDRVQGKPTRQNGQFQPRGQHQKFGAANQEAPDSEMGGTKDGETHNAEDSTAMDMEGSQASKDPSEVVCKFNQACTKPDCPYAHNSPAAPPGTSIDMHDICSYGAACKNHKCVGRHPSPAKKVAFQAEQDCRYGPNCTNPNCQFKHPSMPLCRNGADCKVPNCKFTHSKIFCKFNPCLNPHCTYKHSEDQKRGSFGDKVWTSEEEMKEHVSERKFTDDGVEEEVILPGRQASAEAAGAAEVMT